MFSRILTDRKLPKSTHEFGNVITTCKVCRGAKRAIYRQDSPETFFLRRKFLETHLTGELRLQMEAD